MARADRAFALLAVSAVVSLASNRPANAATTVDENLGYWLDGYSDSSGLYSGLGVTTNVRHDPAGGLVTLDDPTQDGAFVTELIAPASFSAWTTVRVANTASTAGAVAVSFRDEDTGQTYPIALSPASGAWTAQGPLALPVGVARGRLVVHLTHGPVPPTVSALELRWAPKSVLGVGITAVQSSVCAADTIAFRVNAAVSFVNADHLVVYVPMPEAVDNDAPLAAVSFVSATAGGAVNGGAPLTLGAVTVPPNAVYWDLGAKNAGETFVQTFVVRTRMGVKNGTHYEATAYAGAANAEPAMSGTTSAMLQSAPAPFIRKSVGGAYRIAGVDYADPGATLTYTLSGGNYAQTPGRCGETYRGAVVYDDVSEVLTAAGVTTIPDAAIASGGHFTATPLIDVGGSGVDVPAQSVYWLVGDLPVSGRFTLTYQVSLAGGTAVENHAWLRSGQHPEGADATHLLKVGIPWDPSGVFALGDRIRGRTEISAPPTDNRYKTVGYGDTVTFLPYVANGGASALEDVVMIATVAEGTTFDSVFTPPGADVLVRFCGASDCPYPIDLTSLSGWTPATGDLDPAIWSDTPLADTSVVWFQVPHLASPYFPEDGVPVSVATGITATVDRPTGDACPETSVQSDAAFWIFGYTPQGNIRVDGDTSGPPPTRYEPIEVIPAVPNLTGTSVHDLPDSPTAGGTLRYHVTLPNQAAGGGPTDTALDVVVTLTLPQVAVNGVLKRLAFTNIATGGGTVSLDQLPDRVVVRYPKIFPNTVRAIDLDLAVPRGVIDRTTTTVAVKVEGHDDVCGPFTVQKSETTTIRGEPYLAVTKQVSFSVAGPGDDLDYDLTVRNTGDSPATGTWVVDRVPPDSTFVSAAPFPGGRVLFSSATAPALPDALCALEPLDNPRIASNFTPGAAGGDGRWTSPFGAATTWIAFAIDDPALAPPQFASDHAADGGFRVTIRPDAVNGSVLTNEAAVLSSELLQSIGNRVRTTIATRPSLVLDKTCPDVAAAGEHVVYSLAFVNDSTNDDASVSLVDTLPDGLTFVGYDVAWNDVALAAHPAAGLPPLTSDGQTLTFDVTAGLGGRLGPRAGGTLTVEVAVAPSVASGTTVVNQATGETANDAGTFTIFDDCPTLVENADLYARLAVDNGRPRSGEVATYTVFVSNEGAHGATNVSVTETLPTGLGYVPGSARVITDGYALTPATEPGVIGQTLIWSAATGNALTAAGGAPGVFSGRSGDVLLTFQTRVAVGVAPGTSLETCAALTTTTVEDPVYANTACTTVITPLPDPTIQIAGPALIHPRTTVSYALTYGNQANEDAGDVYLVAALPDGPTPANGTVDLGYLGATATHGEALWFYSGTPGAAVAFDPANPAGGGWTQDPASLASVTHVAIVVGALPAYAGPYTVGLQLLAVDPVTGLGPQAGAHIETCAHIASATPDDDPTNNDACQDARTPGVDVASESTCTPSGALPGITPGALITVDAILENTGTVNAYGLYLTPALPAGAVLVGDGTGEALVTGSGGGESAAVDVTGVPLSGAVSWTRDGDHILLGASDAGDPLWYRRVGLAPGDRATVRVTMRLPDELADNDVFTTGATAGTDLRFDADPSLSEELTANNASTCAALVYRADVFVTKAVRDLTTGSADLTRAGDTLGYTVEYGNSGHYEADDVILEDALPPGTDFVVGSVANLFSDAVIIAYDDGSQQWSYAPVGDSGAIDHRVRAFRVRWKDPLAAPANNVFSQSTAPAFDQDLQLGVESDAQRDAVHPTWPRSSPPANDKCAGVSCDSVTSCDNGWTIPEGECCPVCKTVAECPRLDTGCPDGYSQCDSDCSYCDAAIPNTRDWSGDEVVCVQSVSQAIEAWVACLDAPGGSLDSCADLEVQDGWSTCAGTAEPGLPTSCGGISAASCEWQPYIQSLLTGYQSFVGFYQTCLDQVGAGEEARCDGLKPYAAFLGCFQGAADAWCPDAGGTSQCRWTGYQGSLSTETGQLYSAWTGCRDALGDDPLCRALEVRPFAEGCFEGGNACPTGATSDCGWIGQNSACHQLFDTETSRYLDQCVQSYGFEACAWVVPHDVCAPCEVASHPRGSDPTCFYQDWVSGVPILDDQRTSLYTRCRSAADTRGEDPAPCDAVRFPQQWATQYGASCPGPGAPPATWHSYADGTETINRLVSNYTSCVSQYGVDACAPFQVSWPPLADCYADAPHGDRCSIEAWRGDCDGLTFGSIWAPFVACTHAVGKDHLDRCAGLISAYPCGSPLRDTCAALQETGRPDLDTLTYDCWDRDQRVATYSYADCIDDLSSPWDDNDTFTPDLARAACAPAADIDVCSQCRLRCYSADPQEYQAQLQSCIDLDGYDYHYIWGGVCLDRLSRVWQNQNMDPPDWIHEACQSAQPPPTVCGVSAPDCTSGTLAVERIPADPDETVLSWDRLLATTESGALDGVTFSLTNAETGEPLPGLSDVDLGALGVLDLSDLDPTEVPAVSLAARFKGGPDACLTFMAPRDGSNVTYGQGNRALQWTTSDYLFAQPHVLLVTPGAPTVNLTAIVPGLSSVSVLGEGGHVVASADVSGQAREYWVFVPDTPNGTTLSAYDLGSNADISVHDVNSDGWIIGALRTTPKQDVVWVPTGGGYTQVPLPGAGTSIYETGAVRPSNIPGTTLYVPNGPVPTAFDEVTLPIPAGDNPDVSTVLSDGVALGDVTVDTQSQIVLWSHHGGVWAVADLPALDRPTLNGEVTGPNGYGDWVMVSLANDDGTQDLTFIKTTAGPVGDWEVHITSHVSSDVVIYGYLSPDGSLLARDNSSGVTRVYFPDGTSVQVPTVIGHNTVGLVAPGGAVIGLVNSSGRPILWRPHCGSYGEPWLDDWSLLYTTDKNPSFDYQLAVADVCQTSVDNTVDIATTTPEITDANNRASASIAVETADVSVTIAADTSAVLEDDNLTYAITWQNDGPGVARDAVVSALFGDLFVPGDDNATGPWPLGDLDPGASGVITVSGHLDPVQFVPNLTLNASAAIDTATIDCAPGNDAASAAVATGGFPNLTVAVAGPATLTPGASGTYTVHWTNSGNLTMPSATVAAFPPAGVTFVGQGGVLDESGTVSWTLDTVGPGDAGDVSFTVTAPGCDAVASELRVDVTITAGASEVPESSTTDNTATTSTRLNGFSGRVDLVGVSDRATAASGDELVYTAHWSAAGADAVHGATLSAALPVGLDYVAGSASAGGALANGVLTWALGDLLPGDRGAVTWRATVTAQSGEVAASALMASGADTCDATGTAPGVSITGAGLHLVTTADAASVCGAGGDTVGWSIVVTNTADVPASGVVVTDSVPSGTTYQAGSITGPGASAQTAPVMVWNVGPIPAHTGYTLSFRTSAPAGGGYVLKNAPRVQASGVAARTGAAAAIVSDCNGRVDVDKSWDAGCALANGEYAVRLTWQNRSQGVVAGAVVSDQVPAGTAFVSADGGTYDEDGTVTFQVPPLAPGQQGSGVFHVMVTAGAGAPFANVAAITAPGLRAQVSNTVAGVGLACDDGNACTVDGCAPALGCVFLAEPAGTACDDSDLCTQDDRCMDGACVGSEPVVCSASDSCHVVGVCDPQTGVCGDPAGHEEAPCDDGDACTTASACQGGACVGTEQLACDDGNDCTVDGCDPEAGCTATIRDDGSSCSDGNSCTQGDSCVAGECVGTDPVVCTAKDACHYPGQCDPETGTCSDPVAVDGTLCDDGDLCTTEDVCAEGACGGAPVECAAPEACHYAGVCNAATGVCDYDERPGETPVPIHLRDLGTFGGETSEALAVNAAGAVVGWAEDEDGAPRAFWWTLADGLVNLAPNAARSRAFAASDGGIALFVSEDASGRDDLSRRDAAGAVLALWQVGSFDAMAYVNAVGAIAGAGADGSGPVTGWYRAPDGTTSEVAPGSGMLLTVAGLGSGGHVFGTFDNGTDDLAHGYVWSAGTFTDVGAGAVVAVAADGSALVQDGDAVRLVAPGSGSSQPLATGSAVAMNDTGVVVGTMGAAGSAGAEHAFVWSTVAGLVDLGTLGGATSAPVAVNADGLVAGVSDTAFGPRHAFLWSAGGGIEDLGAFGGASVAVALSDSGYVAGTSATAGGAEHVFLWSAARGLEDLGTLSGAMPAVDALSEVGQVAGGAGHGFVSDAPRTACVVCDIGTDTAPPTIVCPVFQALAECVDGGAELALGSPSVSDACGGPVTVTSDAPPVFPVGTTTVTYTATDLAENQASCATVVTVSDDAPPQLACPEDVTIQAAADLCGAMVDMTVTAVDGCDGVDGVTVYTSAPDVFPIGVTHVHAVAVDEAGNAASCDTQVTVVDGSQPVLTCPDSLSENARADICYWAQPLTATLSQQCSADVAVSVDDKQYPIGLSSVLFSADAAGQHLECTTELTVNDVTAPSVLCNAPERVAFAQLPVVATARAADACGVDVTISDVACDDCQVTDQTVTLYSAGTEGGVASWKVTATDPSGNVTSQTCSVTVAAPVVEQPNHDDLVANGGGGCAGGGGGAGAGALVALALLLLAWARRRVV